MVNKGMGRHINHTSKNKMELTKVYNERRNSESVLDIIHRFQKLREDRAKQTGHHLHGHASHFADVKTTATETKLTHSRISERPSSGDRKLRRVESDNHLFKRRSSVPSIFRPFEDTLTIDDTVDDINKNRGTKQDPPLSTPYRRHSVSHAVFEYELAKAQEKKKRSSKVKKDKGMAGKSDDDELNNKWLVGKDLHAHYSLWDRPEYVKHNKRLHKIIKANQQATKTSDAVGDDSSGRPRLFSL